MTGPKVTKALCFSDAASLQHRKTAGIPAGTMRFAVSSQKPFLAHPKLILLNDGTAMLSKSI
ncbi:hypothetical protein [Acinetobacter sp.]|uniref:hypothetical protein n=1 Tax=Acinetobacter sp. TaxID=472 RepID=UPI002FC80FF2